MNDVYPDVSVLEVVTAVPADAGRDRFSARYWHNVCVSISVWSEREGEQHVRVAVRPRDREPGAVDRHADDLYHGDWPEDP